jgi:hypothetical protein
MLIVRTTVSISDELLIAAKRRAGERGQTLGQFIDSALQRELGEADAPRQAPPVPIFHGGTGPRPGIDLTSNRALHEALDDGLALGHRR